MRRRFLEQYLFFHLDDIENMSALNAAKKLAKMFKEQSGYDVGYGWVKMIFRYEIGRRVYEDGTVEFYTDGSLPYEDIYQAVDNILYNKEGKCVLPAMNSVLDYDIKERPKIEYTGEVIKDEVITQYVYDLR